ncbi:MAG: hypothetical protein GEU96_07515 [Propionibacteriales bacterium]|nr:hypothetical protein [Propionibacteriales bacterium]
MTTFDALGFNPAPGSQSQGEVMASRLRAATEALGNINDVLSGTGNQEWEGKTAVAFRGLVKEDLQPRIQEAYESFGTASRALDRWLRDLDGFQSRADALEREAEAARADVAAAQSTVDGMGDAPKDDPAAKKEYDKTVGENNAAVTSSQSTLDGIIARANTLAGESSDSAATTAGALDTAMKAAPDEPGLWDRITGALEDIGEFLGDVVEFVKNNWWDLLHKLVNITATVLSIASLFCPALAPFALAFAVADVLMSGIDWARGVPGAKGAFLTGALGLVGGFAVGKLVGTFMSAAGPALATGPFRVMASGGAASIAAPAAAVLSYNPAFGPALAGYMVIKTKDATDGADAVQSLLGNNTYYSDSLASGWQKARAN